MLYIDMDGVLADFNAGYMRLSGGKSAVTCENKELWGYIKDYYKDPDDGFFETLPLMPDALELWDHVAPHKPVILTAVGTSIESVMEEKLKWARRHFPGVLVLCVRHSWQKSLYVKGRGCILVDDRYKSIDPWRTAGGTGILHRNASDTIEQMIAGEWTVAAKEPLGSINDAVAGLTK